MNFGYYRTGQISAAKKDELKHKLLNIVETERFIFCDEKSSSNTQEQYRLLQHLLRQGDCLYLDRLDSLGNNYKQIAKEWQHITEEIGADIIILDAKHYLDSRQMRMEQPDGLSQHSFLFLLEYLYEIQRSRIRGSQKKSLMPKTSDPKKNGRPKLQIDQQLLKETAMR